MNHKTVHNCGRLLVVKIYFVKLKEFWILENFY